MRIRRKNIILSFFMKLNLRAILLYGVLSSLAPLSLSATDTLHSINPAKPATTASDTVALEDLYLKKAALKEDWATLYILGKNITLNSDMPDRESVDYMAWVVKDTSQKYSLSGNGIMPGGAFHINGSSQFVIDRGIKFFHTGLHVEAAKLIFKAEFSSNLYKCRGENSYGIPNIIINKGASIDFNEATLNPDNSVPIQLSDGSMIRDEHRVTKKHTLQVSGSSSFIGNLSIDSGAALTVGVHNSPLAISASLNLESNSSIIFEQYINLDSCGDSLEPSQVADGKIALKSGTIIARAASITGDLSKVILMERVLDGHSYGGDIETVLKDMKLVSVKNGENYDLILQRISSEDKK